QAATELQLSIRLQPARATGHANGRCAGRCVGGSCAYSLGSVKHPNWRCNRVLQRALGLWYRHIRAVVRPRAFEFAGFQGGDQFTMLAVIRKYIEQQQTPH
ncbi:MAG: hypothetical protein ACKO15_04115, partial [Burkholderiales bacterium]